MRLLVAEDDPLLGQGIEVGLKQSGFTVDRVLDGQAAILALSTVDYELMVLDLGLPRLGGMELLKTLRAKKMWPAGFNFDCARHFTRPGWRIKCRGR